MPIRNCYYANIWITNERICCKCKYVFKFLLNKSHISEHGIYYSDASYFNNSYWVAKLYQSSNIFIKNKYIWKLCYKCSAYDKLEQKTPAESWFFFHRFIFASQNCFWIFIASYAVPVIPVYIVATVVKIWKNLFEICTLLMRNSSQKRTFIVVMDTYVITIRNYIKKKLIEVFLIDGKNEKYGRRGFFYFYVCFSLRV